MTSRFAATRRVFGLVFAAAVCTLLSAHVGSQDVLFDGAAGPYRVRVIVRPPNVVPGRAEVVVRVDAPSSEVRSVAIRPVFWRTGVAGSPSADEMTRVAGQSDVYTGQLWLMTYGAYSVYVTVAGARGSGTTIVPVNSVATGRLGVPRGLGAVLLVLAAVLCGGFLTLIRAAAGESLVPPGEAFDAARRRRANKVLAIAAPLLAMLVLGGAMWWRSVDSDYRRRLYGSPEADATVRVADSHRTLRLVVHDTAAFHAIFARVVPDHGKMMHLFLVSEPAHDVFAHLHPVQTDSLVFGGEIPWLPAGRYRLFGDITLENGSSLTVTNVFDLPPAAGTPTPSDSDDAWAHPSSAAVIGRGATAPLGNGHSLAWRGGDGPLRARTPVDLRFDVLDAKGTVVSVHPYLGMAAHAAVVRDDDSVFIHLHPMGTVTPTAQRLFALRDRGDTTPDGDVRAAMLAQPMSPMTMTGTLSFPYEFPKPGRYRIWVQVKPMTAGSRASTGAFDMDVR